MRSDEVNNQIAVEAFIWAVSCLVLRPHIANYLGDLGVFFYDPRINGSELPSREILLRLPSCFLSL